MKKLLNNKNINQLSKNTKGEEINKSFGANRNNK